MSKKQILGIFLLLSGLSAHATDSLNVRTVGSWPYGLSRAIAVDSMDGHRYAFTGFGGGIFIFDVDTPSMPVKIGEVATDGYMIHQIVINNGHAYLACYDKGLWIADISDPHKPTITGNCPLPGLAVDLAISGGFAYVAGDTTGLFVVDISDPVAPALAGSYNDGGCVWGIRVRDTIAYVADGDSGLSLLNIKTPGIISEIGRYNAVYASYVSLAGRYAYISSVPWNYGSTDVITVVDIGNPANPLFAGSGGEAATRVEIYDSLAFSGAYNNYQIFINTISDSTHPQLKQNYTSSEWGNAWHFAYSPGYIYVADERRGMVIYDISNPANILEIGQYQVPNFITLAVADSHAYLPSYGLRVLDVSVPTSITEQGVCFLDTSNHFGALWDVDVRDSLAYGLPGDSTMLTFNVKNPYTPQIVHTLTLPVKYVYYFTICDTFAYISSDTGLIFVNIADPESPFVIGQYHGIADPVNMTVRNGVAFVADYYAGLKIIDVSDPAAPHEIGHCDITGDVIDVAIEDTFAYITAMNNGLRIVNIADPSNPFEVGNFQMSADSWIGAYGVEIKNNLAYVAWDTFGVRVIDVADPNNPIEIGYHDNNSSPYYTLAWDIKLYDGYVYVVYENWGLQVYEYYGPEAGVSSDNIDNEKRSLVFLLKDAYPNPARKKATISYQLPAKSTVSLNVYNVAGQLVRSMDMGAQQPGYFNIPLKTDKLSSGVYFYKLTAGSNSQTKKFIVLK
ncbi:MAG: hypothetical protein A2509_00670 [Candidatus Edwardsbacteria bacterium RIFOXYD12_FULL_50_11]|uniref:Secretion system C-terminal sorting domain-containing protein n=1 Tax=Candidatus Edwardsbacteria bacterium GWF2_54_11 TaxID=1817851 RepID=A0A1F5RC79_9BACT|nr:MAG: hypothetical protein A2502_07805 [Candidatus Edwardsbacteria bacterium RifOxyC12_full_54_24]OGF07499.1 MAG: hypothetical protein A2273_03255 [Candidatus Edwardsbacteria bacterium RifOxyA12_full_54_48]OGF09749.1 MAG: hypothetical protein A3K15_09665 [Candidatus Edwardsbacteria bacterium GWE2_54_12]OGF12012.1 MAG: hypothetical protein A2024_03220 [Candidatus Edwardsbacteria bacterium GWF2_54_11]OGF16110.1 MAG: hypothetical protein A2509_00670 [Candidatus Edwardsbacteria bacterium RIFOXYD1